MKKALAVLFLICLAGSVFAQTIVPSKLDFSKAELHPAGPDAVYITDVFYAGTGVSVLLKYNGADGATIYGPYFDEDKFILDSYEFGSATIAAEGMATLVISDLILGGQGFSGRLKFDGVNTLKLAGFWQSETPMTCEEKLAKAKKDILIAEKRGEERVVMANQITDLKIAAMEEQLAAVQAAAATGGAAAVAMMAPTKVAQSGFTGGTGISGNWSVATGGAVQSDATALYAKFEIPLDQSAGTTLFSFDAEADGSGRVGYGLHFFGSDSMYDTGYGYGSSYLVWLTRDPGYYGTDTTYLQLYQSFDDVKMVQLVSIAIPDSMSAKNSVAVLYDKMTGLVTAKVNGFVFPPLGVMNPIASGDSVVLRTLGGPVTFSDLTVKTK